MLPFIMWFEFVTLIIICARSQELGPFNPLPLISSTTRQAQVTPPALTILNIHAEFSTITVEWSNIGAPWYQATLFYNSTVFASDNSTNQQTSLNNLTPGTLYTLVVTCGNVNGQSINPTRNDILTIPNNPANFKVLSVTNSSVSLSWRPPISGNWDYYQVSYCDNSAASISNSARPNCPTVTLARSMNNYLLNGLKPSTSYAITIYSEAVGGSMVQLGIGVPLQVVTTSNPAGSPSPPTNLTITASQSGSPSSATNTLLIQWQPPSGSSTILDLLYYYAVVQDGTPATSAPLANGTTTKVQLTVSGAGFALKYHVVIYSLAQGWVSDPVTGYVFTPPMQIAFYTTPLTSETTALLAWSLTAQRTSPVTPFVNQQGVSFRVRCNVNPSLPSVPEIVVNTNETAVEVTGLLPGRLYLVNIYAVYEGALSLPTVLILATNPLPPISLYEVVSQRTTSSVTVAWTYNSTASGEVNWRLAMRASGTTGSPTDILTTTDSNTLQHVITGLTSGQHYTILVYGEGILGKESLTPATLNVTAQPTVAFEFRVTTDQSSITVSYLPEGNYVTVYDTFLFTLTTVASAAQVVSRLPNDTSRTVTFTGLKAGTSYNVTAVMVSGGVTSDPTVITARTALPTEIFCTVQATNITLTAQSPISDVSDFVITTFCDPPCYQPDLLVVSAPPFGTSYVHIFANLQPQTAYTFEVTFVKASNSVASSQCTCTTPGVPSLAMALPLTAPTLSSIGPDYAILAFIAPFTARNGPIIYYSVIVAPGDFGESTITNYDHLASWQATHLESPPRTPYFAIYHCPDLFTAGDACWNLTATSPSPANSARKRRQAAQSIAITIGGDKRCQYGTAPQYCNGPLTPAYTYSVILRGYTANVLYADTSPSSPFTTADLASTTVSISFTTTSSAGSGVVSRAGSPLTTPAPAFPTSGQAYATKATAPPSNVGAIVGGVIGGFFGFVLLVLLVLLLVYCLRLNRGSGKLDVGRNNGYQMRLRSSLKKAPTSYVIPVKDYRQYFLKMNAKNGFRFIEQFEELKLASASDEGPIMVADQPINKRKNRFANMLPYDRSRVVLTANKDDGEGSDYVNASWMPGFNFKREFIACQGPLASTVNDFWRMIWEHDCQSIVMLTRCVEKEKEKCFRYWPIDSEPMYYGHIQVQILKEDAFPDWTVSRLCLTKDGVTKVVQHYYYLMWMDFGVPESPGSLVRFVRLVRSNITQSAGPVVVHCSAGCGRTGTFIALDRLLQQSQQGIVDIYGTIYDMRKHRLLMVQTEDQYVFIHKAVFFALEGGGDGEDDMGTVARIHRSAALGQANAVLEEDEVKHSYLVEDAM